MSILRDNNRYRVTIGENVYCTCSPSQRADRNICCHAVWVYLNLFDLLEDNDIIPQVRLDLAQLNILFTKCPDNVPQNLSTCLEKPVKRTFDPMIESSEVWRRTDLGSPTKAWNKKVDLLWLLKERSDWSWNVAFSGGRIAVHQKTQQCCSNGTSVLPLQKMRNRYQK